MAGKKWVHKSELSGLWPQSPEYPQWLLSRGICQSFSFIHHMQWRWETKPSLCRMENVTRDPLWSPNHEDLQAQGRRKLEKFHCAKAETEKISVSVSLGWSRNKKLLWECVTVDWPACHFQIQIYSIGMTEKNSKVRTSDGFVSPDVWWKQTENAFRRNALSTPQRIPPN